MAAAREPQAPADRRSADRDRAGLAVVAALAAGAAAAVLTAPALPFQDLPAHGAILRLLADPNKYTTWFFPTSPFVHSWLSYLVAGATTGPLGLDGSIKFFVALTVAGFPVAAWTLGRWATGRGTAAGLAGVVVAFNTSVGMGFLPWTLSCVFALLGTAWVARLLVRGSGTLFVAALAAVVSVMAYGLHFFGYLLFAGLAGSFALAAGRRGARVAVALAAVAPGALILLGCRIAGGGGIERTALDLGAVDPGAGFVLLGEVLTLGSRPMMDDVVAWISLAVVAAGVTAGLRERRGGPRAPLRTWALVVAAGLFCLAILLPNQMTVPRIVLAGGRMVPVALVLAAMAGPRRGLAGRAFLGALGVAGLLAVGFAATAVHLDGATLVPQARQFDRLVPGRVLASVATHRPPPKTILTNHAGIHLPERYLATGRGVTVFPFLHADSLVALRLPYSMDVEEQYRDLPTFLDRASSWADLAAGELGDDDRAAAAMATAGFHPCERRGEGDWRFWTRRPEPCFEPADW